MLICLISAMATTALAQQPPDPVKSDSMSNTAMGSNALFNVKLPTVQGIAPKLSAGGSFFISSGSRATSYYQPLATLWVPVGKKMSWFADWRYYGYGEAFYLYEGFRTNLVTTGLRFTR